MSERIVGDRERLLLLRGYPDGAQVDLRCRLPYAAELAAAATGGGDSDRDDDGRERAGSSTHALVTRR